MAIPNYRYSFAPGFLKLTLADSKKVKVEISELLGCSNDVMFCRRKNNYRNMPSVVYEEITSIFSKYGVPKDEVWEITKV